MQVDQSRLEQPVSEIDFQPEKRTIEDLFVGPDYYVIPRFQRPYSWDRDNLDDFWRDVVFDNSVGYFIGPMVAWRDPSSSIRRVVDGQQRLTTIAVMFAVLRDQLSALSERKLAEGLDRYLQKRDRDNEPQFTLQTETEARYLSQAIFKFPPDRSITPVSDEDASLAGALAQIERLVDDGVKARRDPVEWLLELRDRLLGLRVIWVEHGNEDDAYIIFETLNSRGKDLEVVDLLKNHLLNKLRGTGNVAADTFRSRWAAMRAELESTNTKERIDVNRFILHWWLSQEEYVAQRKLFRSIKDKVKTKPSASARLDSLIRDVPLYRAVAQPESRKWPHEEAEAKRSLQALVAFGIVQPAPLLLSLMRARTDKPKLSAAQFRRALQTIERYHFQYTVVSQLSSSGGVSEMYAKAARQLTNAGADQQKRADALDEIRQKLIDRAPDRDQFILAFAERFFFTNDYTRDSKLVRYVLGCFLRDASPTTGQDNLTIEHVMSQEEMGGGQPLEVVGSIGNLLLVSEAVNSKMDNKDFAAKRKVLAKDGRPYDIGGILDQQQWTDLEIQARTVMLAERAYDQVWKLPV